MIAVILFHFIAVELKFLLLANDQLFRAIDHNDHGH